MGSLAREDTQSHSSELMPVLHKSVGYSESFTQFGSSKCYLPNKFEKYFATIEDFEVRDDDLWICSFVKAGTTWTKELAWLLQNNLDYEAAKVNSIIRVPYFEFDAINNFHAVSDKLGGGAGATRPSSIQTVKEMKSPRIIQCHLPWNLLPRKIREGIKKPKIIYVTRNPKDVCVSFYHHRVLIEGYTGQIDGFVDEFISDRSLYAPFWSHVKRFWDMRDDPNVLFNTYEEMKRDLPGIIDKTAKFMGKEISKSEKEKLLEHLSFESMKSNPSVNKDEYTAKLADVRGVPRKTDFMRKGKVGSWKEELSSESIHKLEEWYRKNEIPGIWDL